MRTLAFALGLLLLLPGACSVFAMLVILPDRSSGIFSSNTGPLILLWAICFAVSFGGFLLMRYGMKK